MMTNMFKALPKAFLILVSGMVTISPAMSSTLYKLNSNTSTTATSGTSSNFYYYTLGTTGDYKGIYRISNWETSTHPCKMKIKRRHVNNYNTGGDAEEIISNCNNDKITVGYQDTETYIRGVQVCTSNSRIKGIRIWGSKLNRSNGTLSNVSSITDTRPNCSQWHSQRFCPAGQIATQLEAIYNQGHTDFQGLALICREIAPK
jgi:hypothetical protein